MDDRTSVTMHTTIELEPRRNRYIVVVKVDVPSKEAEIHHAYLDRDFIQDELDNRENSEYLRAIMREMATAHINDIRKPGANQFAANATEWALGAKAVVDEDLSR